jgi:hypothetical protein
MNNSVSEGSYSPSHSKLNRANENPQSVQIVVDSNLTLAQLRQLAAENFITFTPHVGNKWREDLYLLNEPSLQVVNFERNAGKLDVLDQPEKLKLNGQVYEISSDAQSAAVMTPYLQFDQDLLENLPDDAKTLITRLEARTPSQLHQNSTKAALPHGKLSLSGETFFLGEENKLLRDLIAALHQELLREGQGHYKIFNRYVNPQGNFLHIEKSADTREESDDYKFISLDNSYSDQREFQPSAPEKLPEQFFELTEKLVSAVKFGELPQQAEGPLPRNELMTLMLALKPLLAQGQKPRLDEQGNFHAYAVSGPSMIDYVNAKEFKSTLGKLYSRLRSIAAERFQLDLPANIIFHFIPGAGLSYLPVEGESDAIDALSDFISIDQEYRDLQTKIKSDKSLQSVIAETRKKHQNAVANLAEASYKFGHISQYDLLAGKQLLPPDQIALIENTTFKQHQIIADLRERISKEGLGFLNTFRNKIK